MKKIAIITSHPIQYNAPWFRILAENKKVEPKIYYTWGQSQQGAKYDPGFGKIIEWDIPLLDGYQYTFVKNISTKPGTHHYNGIVNPTLINEIENWKPDALLVMGWSFKSHLKCLRYFHNKIPVIFRGDSTLLDEKAGFKKFLRRIFLRWVYSYIDYALYVGKNNRSYFVKHGLQSKQLISAPHAIDNERFSHGSNAYQQKVQAWKKKLEIEPDDLVILFAGKLEKKKNPFLLLDVAKKIKNTKVRFLFAGNGALEPLLKQAALNDKRFLFIGFQNQLEMPVIYRLCDIFILPSTGPNETWGLSVNEAMACGKAIAISDKVGCGEDLVKDGCNGTIFPVTSIDPIVDFINKAANKNIEIKKMGEYSKTIIGNFSYEHIVTPIEDLVMKL